MAYIACDKMRFWRIKGVIITFTLRRIPACMALTALSLIIMLPMAPGAYALEKDGRQAYYAENGDTVEKIAFYYDVDSELLAAMNNTMPERRLRPGQVIWLPLEPQEQEEQQSIIVAAGDTLWGLAKKYATSVAELCRLNNIGDSNFLRVGQTLLLPQQEKSGGPAVMVLARNEPASRGGRFVWPVEGIISSAFGWRSRGWHCGLDIAADYGSMVRAVNNGVVTQAGWRSEAYGYTVMLDHGNGLETLYAHNSRVLVTEGQFVRQGQALAEVGATGNATGAHVHLEVRLNNVCQNPQEYLR